MSVEDMAGFLVEAFGKCRKVRQGGVRPGVSARKDKTHGAALAQGRADASHGAACADGKGRAAKDLSHSASAGERREAESAAGPRDRAAQDAATDLLFDDDNMGEELDLFEQYDYGRPREALSPVVPPPSAHPGVGSKEKEPGERAYPPPTYLFNPKKRKDRAAEATSAAPTSAHYLLQEGGAPAPPLTAGGGAAKQQGKVSRRADAGSYDYPSSGTYGGVCP
ncbi:hypothetical protein T484DRAFT_1830765 [Baffinella frigidus]|nr:hypothetical protein T484DRAFT_1830765 [Cryptophyta sp. CCMP2293]